MRESAKPWRSWNRFDWSEALLEHYFGIAETTDPVRALVVVGEELVRVTGDPEAQAAEVEDLLRQRILRSVGTDPFWLHAKAGAGAGSGKPDYLGYLIVACLAATDLDDGDENSYIARLGEITAPTRGDLNLEIMADLWRHLAVWLDKHPAEYRPLVLPDPGGWTRIGYTVKLAFPSRRDQIALAKILSLDHLTVEDPPVGLVIDAVLAANKATLSDRFRSEFNVFRKQRDARVSPSVLRESPFWIAVRATASTVVGYGEKTVHWALLASDDGFDLDLQLASDGEVTEEPFSTATLDEPIGRWTYEAKGSNSDDDPVALLLAGVHSLPGLSQLIRGGLVPFVEELHGHLESTGRREELPDARAALVSNSLVTDITSRFGSARSRVRPSGIEGWKFVEGLSLHVTNSRELQGTTLEGCWILHESPSPARIRTIGGVRVGNAWVGIRHLLPMFRVDSATSVTARTNGTIIALRREDLGTWTLPPQDFEGPLELVATNEDQNFRTQLEFVRAPSTESFRVVASPDSWVYEDQARSRSFFDRWSEDTPVIVEIGDVEQTMYLGRDIGSFLRGRDGAAWAVVQFGNARLIRCLVPLEESAPLGRVEDAGTRRRWRRSLTVDAATTCDPATAATLRRILSNANEQSDLPIVPRGADGRLPPALAVVPHPRLDDVITATVAISNRQAGFDRRRFTALICETLGVEPSASASIVRAWQEAGLVDEVVNVRWSGRKLFAVPPHFQAFRTTSGIRGTFCGLWLAITSSELSSLASRAGMTVASVPACSPYLPKMISVQADTLDQITGLAAHLRLPVHRLPADPFLTHDGRDLNNNPPKVGYQVEPAEVVGDTVEVARVWQRGAPSFWTIRTTEFATWSHFVEAVHFWARTLAGTLDVEMRGLTEFTIGSTRLPLTAARWLSTVGGSRSGPTGPRSDDPYVYSAPTAALRTRFLDGLQRFQLDNVISMHGRSKGD